MIDELGAAWEGRHDPANRLPHVFDHTITGCVDTFPIIINRPKGKNNVQRWFYQGKYACHIVKVSLNR